MLFTHTTLQNGCHPEERSELRILPAINDNKEHWSDSEHTRPGNESAAGRFRMTAGRRFSLIFVLFMPKYINRLLPIILHNKEAEK